MGESGKGECDGEAAAFTKGEVMYASDRFEIACDVDIFPCCSGAESGVFGVSILELEGNTASALGRVSGFFSAFLNENFALPDFPTDSFLLSIMSSSFSCCDFAIEEGR